MHYLVTGGAGFVGSHMVLGLLDAGHEVTVLDNLTTGHRSAVPDGVEFCQVDLCDQAATYAVLGSRQWDGVLHFAAHSLVSESMRDPFFYFEQNYLSALNLVKGCVDNNINKLIFSSTAALFGGKSRVDAINESDKIDPSSPYGESKFFIERILLWADRLHGLRSGCLRYFNAAGADPAGRAGECHDPETHLIPRAVDTALGIYPHLHIFGNDFPTHDGSCIRDYVHVTDLVDAHLLTLPVLDTRSVTYNIGNGMGYSNYEVVQSVERVIGHNINWSWSDRRPGDPAVLVADASKIRAETGWAPRFSEIDKIVETTLRWRAAHPQGYRNSPADRVRLRTH